MKKKILSRTQFEALRLKQARLMAQDERLLDDALSVKVRAEKYYWIHQTNWFGEPILNLPQDLLAMQEIIFNTRPDYIIEVGTAWGGGLLYYASLLKLLDGKKVIGVDIFIPPDLKKRVARLKPLQSHIAWVHGSSLEQKTIAQVKKIIGTSKRVLVILDSNHTHQHVLQELKLYAPFVKKGQYLVCADTVVEYQAGSHYDKRPWGKGDNPKSALDEFLKTEKRFRSDADLENKLLLTSMRGGGYLKCLR